MQTRAFRLSRHRSVPQTVVGRYLCIAVSSFCLLGLTRPIPASAQEADRWEKRTLHEITLETPTPFVSRNETFQTLPQAVRDTIAEADMQFAMADGGFAVIFARKVMKEGQKADLEGSARGSLKKGLPQYKKEFELTPVKVDGLEARRASCTSKEGETTVHLDGLFIQQGQKIWLVQVYYMGDSRAGDSARILESVHVKTK